MVFFNEIEPTNRPMKCALTYIYELFNDLIPILKPPHIKLKIDLGFTSVGLRINFMICDQSSLIIIQEKCLRTKVDH